MALDVEAIVKSAQNHRSTGCRGRIRTLFLKLCDYSAFLLNSSIDICLSYLILKSGSPLMDTLYNRRYAISSFLEA